MATNTLHEDEFVARAETALADAIRQCGRGTDGRLERVRDGGRERIVHFHVAWSSIEVWLDDVAGGDLILITNGRGRLYEYDRAAMPISSELIAAACGRVTREIAREEERGGQR